MNLSKMRWSRVYESSEEELISLLGAKGIIASRVTADQFETTDIITTDSDTTLWCAEGSLTLDLFDQRSISMQSGDYITIPANIAYEINAGLTGYTLYKS